MYFHENGDQYTKYCSMNFKLPYKYYFKRNVSMYFLLKDDTISNVKKWYYLFIVNNVNNQLSNFKDWEMLVANVLHYYHIVSLPCVVFSVGCKMNMNKFNWKRHMFVLK